MEKLIWDVTWSVGNHELDLQHRILIDIVNELATREAETNPKVFAQILSGLTDFFKVHCRNEEDYMKEHRYPLLEKHKAKHRHFIFYVSRFNLDFRHQVPTGAEETYLFIKNWLVEHELKADMGYKDFIEKSRKRDTGEARERTFRIFEK